MPRSYVIGRALVMAALTVSLIACLAAATVLVKAAADWAGQQNRRTTSTTP